MGLTLVTDAASLAVTLADISPEMEGYYEQSTANDAVLTQKLREAIKYVQNKIQRQLIQATWKHTFQQWPDCDADGYFSYKVDLVPLVSITSVKYYDVDGTQQTVSSSLYWTITTATRPFIAFKPAFSYPSLESGRPDAIEVTFVAGYANAASVPDDLKTAIKMMASYWYTKKDAATVADAAAPGAAQSPTYGEIPFGVFSILDMYKADGYT